MMKMASTGDEYPPVSFPQLFTPPPFTVMQHNYSGITSPSMNKKTKKKNSLTKIKQLKQDPSIQQYEMMDSNPHILSGASIKEEDPESQLDKSS